MTENPAQSGKTGTINHAGSMGALLGLFVIACVEFQRLWPTGTSVIYLLVSLPLLLMWIAHQTGWTVSDRQAGLAVDIALYVLLVASLGIRFGSGQPGSELASTLLYWAPLVAAWWAWRYQNLPRRLWLLLGGFFVVLTWQLASDHERLDEHLILSLFVALLVRYASRTTLPAAERCLKLHDPLTGLPSPEIFESELAHVSAIADRYQFPLSLIGCRVAEFESDQFTDQHLAQCAETISDRLRTSDTACRWERGTFLILMPNTPETSANKVAQDIRDAFTHFNFGQKFRFTVAIATVQHDPGEDPMSTLNALENKLTTITA